MFTIGIAVGSAVVTGVIVYVCVSKQLAVAKATIKLREDEMQQLREDDAMDLQRQAEQYVAQINNMKEANSELEKKLNEAQQGLRIAVEEKTRNEANLNAERDKVAKLGEQYKDTLAKAEDRFMSLAQKIFDERSAKLQSEGEKGMKVVAGELQTIIKDFRERIETINSDSIDRSGKLEQHITDLFSRTNEVSAQANNLAEAIRGRAQVTGEWGEMQLKRVLELGGLQETVDYSYQETFSSPGAEQSNIRTDVLLKMSDNRWMVIDAKTTMAGYADLAQAKTTEAHNEAVGKILKSVKSHIEEMKRADYRNTLERVTGKNIHKTMLMYIPFEDVYLMAMKAEVSVGGKKRLLREYAIENGIVLINSTGLLPMVSMLGQYWSVAKANEKAMKLKGIAEDLVEKLRAFMTGTANDGFFAIGKHLSKITNCYNESVKRLSSGKGNILGKLREMRENGVSNTDNLPCDSEVESKMIDLAIEKTDEA